MKFTLSVNDFKQGLGEISKGLGNNKMIEIFGSVLIDVQNDTIVLTATDGNARIEKTINAQIDEQGTELVNAELLLGVINQLNASDDVSIHSKDNVLHIKSNNVNVKQKCLNYDSYPQRKTLNGEAMSLSVNATEFSEAVSKALVCVAKDYNRPALRGINISYKNGKLRVIGCDGYRIARIEMGCNANDKVDEKFSATIPHKSMILIQSICGGNENITLTFNETSVQIKTDTTLIVASLIADKYFDTSRIISNDFKFSAVVENSEIKQALALTQVVVKTATQNIAKFDIGDTYSENTISILSNETSDIAHSKFDINAKFDTDLVENYTIGLNANFVMDCLKTIKDDNVKLNFNENTKPVVITAENESKYLFLILPIRLQ